VKCGKKRTAIGRDEGVESEGGKAGLILHSGKLCTSLETVEKKGEAKQGLCPPRASGGW